MNINNMNFNSTPLDDSSVRERALSSLDSFIVQAPAGSGKTELLVQRFLFLLGTAAQVPQEILAITFTKKAAAEMRERILHALEFAKTNNSPPDQAHKAKTWLLAKKVLQQNAHYHWDLFHNLGAINIMTFDAFFYKIVSRAPILSGLIGNIDISNNPHECYQQAAKNILISLDTNSHWQPHLKNLLIHLNNDFNSLENLFCDILSKRDQWLPFIPAGESSTQVRKILEANLLAYLNSIITECIKHLPANLVLKLEDIFKQEYVSCKNHLEQWQWIADLLLTDAGEWRKRFPSQKFQCPDNQIKEAFKQLIEEIAPYEDAREQLKKIKGFPKPAYSEQQWQILNSLIVLLPVLYAELKLVFSQRNVVDYIEIALSALNAIGTHDEPTSLTLYLDHSIRHILIDEFQDTSITQYRFLEQLTSGWLPDDGRTLFLVGDPMQSIYRFRQAEVGLFLKTKKYGINSLKLEYLQLTANFRSSKTLINWFNQTFYPIFPADDQINSGAIAFSPSSSQNEDIGSEIIMRCFSNQSNGLTHFIVEKIKDEMTHPNNQKIAILARNRSHLTEILAVLNEQRIPFNASEINALKNFTIIQDLLCLTRLLLHLEDRIAWLAFLRSPWCGLSLQELHTIVNCADKSIWSNIKLCIERQQLSPTTIQRLSYVINALETAFSTQLYSPLSEWIEETWHSLQGQNLITNNNEVLAVKKFFDLLCQFDYASLLLEFSLLEEVIAKSYIDYVSSEKTKLEIMTMHKAKGLEFDVVFIPHLEKTTQHDAHQLLLWHDHLDDSDHYQLVITPIKSAFEKEDLTYQVLRNLNKEKSDNEMIRLFYVAVTRAKTKLYLLSELTIKEEDEIAKPNKGSFLSLLWPYYEEQLIANLEKIRDTPENMCQINPTNHPLKRISKYPSVASKQTSIDLVPPAVNLLNSNSISRELGTLIHYGLYLISQTSLPLWNLEKQELFLAHCRYKLNQFGLSQDEFEAHLSFIHETIQRVASDPKGQWILAEHKEAQSEYDLSYYLNGKYHRCIVDRTFIDNKGTRWIIDYKTDDEENENFIKDRHAKQLANYAQAFQLIEDRPIKLAIYIPTKQLWFEWAFNKNDTTSTSHTSLAYQDSV